MRPEGVVVPMVTPMQPGGTPDLAACEPLVRWLAESRVDAIMLAGTSGEGHALSDSDLNAVTAAVAPAWRAASTHHGKLLVTVSAPSTSAVLRRADAVLRHRPDGLVVSPPYYFRYTDAELIAHYESLGPLGVPVIAYDTPRYTGNPFSPELIDALGAMPHVTGIKMSAGDIGLVEHACAIDAAGGSLAVAQGDEDRLVAALRIGASAIIPGVANLVPGRCVALYQATRANDWAAAEGAQTDLRRLAAIHRIRRGVVATKTAMYLAGRCPPHASAPFLPYDERELIELRAVLASVSDLLDAESA